MILNKVRNIGIAAHIDAGKTTVTERILFYSGIKNRMGEVHDGQATMDFMKQEQERGITIASAAISCNWDHHQINIIDTPGHVDFTVEVERSLRVIDGMIALFSAVDGVEPQSETVWNQADRYKVPRIAFINKMDRQGSNFNQCLTQMAEQLDANPIAFQLPIGSEEEFSAVIDLIDMKLQRFSGLDVIEEEIPSALTEQALAHRNCLIEKLSDYNDELMGLFLENQAISSEFLKAVAREATIKLLITPVFCGAAYKNKGIQALLNAIVNYLPSPIDKGAVVGMDCQDPSKTHSRHPNPHDPLCALAFKIIHDPFVGSQCFVRVYSGELSSGMTLFNSTKNKIERIGRILRIQAKDRVEVNSAGPGDIVALIGMKATKTGDTLCEENQPLLLESIFIPPPVIEFKISPQSRNEEEKLMAGLRKLAMEDPSFQVKVDKDTSETIISGMGELHLDVMVDRLKTEFGISAQTGAPAVALKSTVTTESTAEKRYVKQTGGKGQYAHCILRVEPNPDKGFEFVDRIRGGSIPQEFIPAIKKGIETTLAEGVLEKYPVVDVRVVLLDGTYHDVDSSDLAFKICGSMCFKEAFLKASPVLLEPIMKIEVNTPDDFIGAVVGDLNGRRGHIASMRRFRKGAQKLNGTAPLMQMFGYATSLRSLSSGRASYSMEFSHYSQVPKTIMEKILHC